MSKHTVSMQINGETYTGEVEGRKTLSDFIREDCRLTGTHVGCEHGVCGACTVLVDGEAVRSCLMFAVQAEGTSITTMEGLVTDDDQLGIVQQAFMETHGLQCGFCTPGFVVSVHSFLTEHPNASEKELREGLSGNICRCTGYQGIVRAAQLAQQRMTEEVSS